MHTHPNSRTHSHLRLARTRCTGKHLGPTAEFNRQQFQEMMRGLPVITPGLGSCERMCVRECTPSMYTQFCSVTSEHAMVSCAGELWRFSRRELANVLALSDSDEFQGTILMLKLFENRFEERMEKLDVSVAEIKHDLRMNGGGGGGRSGGGSEAGAEARAGGTGSACGSTCASEEMPSDPVLLQMMKTMIGTVQEVCVLVKHQSAELGSIKSSLDRAGTKHALGEPVDSEADSKLLPGAQRKGKMVTSARHGATVACQQLPTSSQLTRSISVPSEPDSLGLRSGFDSPLSSRRAEADEAARERGRKTLEHHRRLLEAARQTGNAPQEAEALWNVERCETWMQQHVRMPTAAVRRLSRSPSRKVSTQISASITTEASCQPPARKFDRSDSDIAFVRSLDVSESVHETDSKFFRGPSILSTSAGASASTAALQRVPALATDISESVPRARAGRPRVSKSKVDGPVVPRLNLQRGPHWI